MRNPLHFSSALLVKKASRDLYAKVASAESLTEEDINGVIQNIAQDPALRQKIEQAMSSKTWGFMSSLDQIAPLLLGMGKGKSLDDLMQQLGNYAEPELISQIGNVAGKTIAPAATTPPPAATTPPPAATTPPPAATTPPPAAPPSYDSILKEYGNPLYNPTLYNPILKEYWSTDARARDFNKARLRDIITNSRIPVPESANQISNQPLPAPPINNIPAPAPKLQNTPQPSAAKSKSISGGIRPWENPRSKYNPSWTAEQRAQYIRAKYPSNAAQAQRTGIVYDPAGGQYLPQGVNRFSGYPYNKKSAAAAPVLNTAVIAPTLLQNLPAYFQRTTKTELDLLA